MALLCRTSAEAVAAAEADEEKEEELEPWLHAPKPGRMNYMIIEEPSLTGGHSGRGKGCLKFCLAPVPEYTLTIKL